VLAEQAHEIATVTVGPVHHGRNTETVGQHGLARHGSIFW